MPFFNGRKYYLNRLALLDRIKMAWEAFWLMKMMLAPWTAEGQMSWVHMNAILTEAPRDGRIYLFT